MGNKCCGERKKRSELQLKVLVEALCHRKFKEPAQPIGAAGGTASFYRLLPEEWERSDEEWLGKDLCHAFDELEFYEAAKGLRDKPGWELLNYMIEYAGSLKDFPVQWSEDEVHTLDLLVMRSLVEGLEKPRLLDLKIGSKTSAANWKGKSAVASWRQGLLDSFTNSASEGLRLEGFMNPPHWIESEDPLHDVGGGELWARGRVKKARRFYFQRMATSEVLAALTDFRAADEEDDGKNEQRLWPAECAELALLAIVRDLGQILRACRALPVPQKWIGSSVAVVVESGRGKLRPQPASGDAPGLGSLSHKASVRIFDWGRSELNTPTRHMALPEDSRADREEFWAHYQAGVSRLLWEAARLYWSGFCVAEWASLRVNVYDYDSQTGNDLLGVAETPLPARSADEALLTLPLEDANGTEVLGQDGQRSEVTITVCFATCPEPTRLQGCWRVRVVSAAHLPASDPSATGWCTARCRRSWGKKAGDLGLASASTSDPFAVVTLLEEPGAAAAAIFGAPGGGQRRKQARTAVAPASLDPTWDEAFDFPLVQAEAAVATSAGTLAGEAALSRALVGEAKLPERGTLSRVLPAPRELSTSSEASKEEAVFLRAFLEQLYEE